MPEVSGFWVGVVVVVLVLGSWLGLRIGPRDRALGMLRENARKLKLNPRLVVAPDWLGIEKNDLDRKPMVAYYWLVLDQAQLPLLRGKIVDNKLKVVHGEQKYQDFPVALKGAFAIELQSNAAGLYWDEDQDLKGEQLSQIKQVLYDLAHFSEQ